MLKTLLAIALLFISAAGHSQPLTSAQIDNLVNRSMAAFKVPGIAVAVIKDGKVIHSKGYGLRSLNTKQPVDENTLFGIASNTKAFTATALGILVDEGKIKWDDKVRDFIPEFKLYDPYVTEEFTIRDLLTHRSGMGLGAGDLMFFPDGSDFILKDIIYNLRFLKPVSGFRNTYAYDNNLYIIAGEVVTRASGQNWDDFVEQRILQPLGMTKSAGSFDRLKDTSNVIDAHSTINGKVEVISRSSLKSGHPAGGINSSIADLSKWVLFHLSHGKYLDAMNKQIISEKEHEEIWSPQTIIPIHGGGPYNTHFAAYALGFGVSDVKGYKQLSHTGGLPGMVTQITMIPELNLGIIVLTNQEEGGAFVSITNQIKDGYLGMTGTDRVTEYSNQRKRSLEMADKITDSTWQQIDAAIKQSKEKMDFSIFAGTYNDKWLGDITVSVKNSKYWFQSKRSPRLSGELFAYKGNSFVVKWTDRSLAADAFVVFSLDENGKASGITMKPVSPLTDFSYDFQDLDFHRQ